MTFFDDKTFLLSHIRHSFITCDDTGMCEMVMLNETMPNRFFQDSSSSILDSTVTKKILANIDSIFEK